MLQKKKKRMLKYIKNYLQIIKKNTLQKIREKFLNAIRMPTHCQWKYKVVKAHW